MFLIVNLRKYRILIALIVTLMIIAFLVMFPQFILRFFYPIKYGNIIYKYAEDHKVDPYLVMAIIKVESNYDPKAVSIKGAKGLMQLTDQTAVWGAERLKMEDFDPNAVFEPETNIRIGCWYLNNLMQEFDNNVSLVLAAYNGGSGNVSKWLKDREISRSGKKLDKIPFKETEDYIQRVVKEYNIYKKLYEKG